MSVGETVHCGDGHVTLCDMLPRQDADMAIVNAARVSFGARGKGGDEDRRLLRYLMEHRHTSPFEHVVFTFEVDAPVVVWWQWVRHRTWSFNFQSGRYTEFRPDRILENPGPWRRQSESNRQASDGLVSLEDDEALVDLWTEHKARSVTLYQTALAMGVAREQARMFLPGFAAMYRATCTVDLHNLMHFIRLRATPEAQVEIAQYAAALWKVVRSTIPWTAEIFEGEAGL